MWKSISICALVLLLAVTAGGSAFELSNETPLADAGLDQEVTRGATVLLDGTGSTDPDGRIDGYRWTIRTPDGETITPQCRDCGRTHFEPVETGTYEVTLTVIDDEGAENSDTLYVTVSPGERPQIALSGPQSPTEGDSATYSATFEAGAAPLDYVVWTVDDVEVANESLSDGRTDDSFQKIFPTPGARTVTATVYDTDGQQRSDSLQVSVEPDSPTQPPENGGRNPEPSSSIAAQTSPTVTGDKVITGRRPLRGSYAVATDASPQDIESIEWHDTAGNFDDGWTLTRTWLPGNHEIYGVVTYTDGSRNVATFKDGSTEVTVDPAPNASFESLDRYGSISGLASATDGYENLRMLRVEVDGRVVERSRPTLRGRSRLNWGKQRNLRFSETDFTPGEEYQVTVRAVDKRGQTTKITKTIVPVKKPEIVKSEFINDPVDSYHERISPDRYAAHHILKIDLNGVSKENIKISANPDDDLVRSLSKSNSYQVQSYNENEDTITVSNFWSGEIPGTYGVFSMYEVKDRNVSWSSQTFDSFKVSPSQPELRLDVISDGTAEYETREHGIVVDASESFDPDGSDLKYIWKHGAEPIKPDNSTAKFSSYERAAVIVEDRYKMRTQRDFDFLVYYLPEIAGTEVLTKGPYYPNETVKVGIATQEYDFSKVSYYHDFELGLRVSDSDAEILSWKKSPNESERHSNITENPRRYEGIIEIPASALAPDEEDPEMTVYNIKNSRKKTSVEFPNVAVLVDDGQYWSNVTVRNHTYLVEKPRVDEIVANSEAQRNKYLRRGYEVEERNYETKYTLEKRVKVQNAEYQTVTKKFKTRQERKMFLQFSPAWQSSGISHEQETRTEIDSEWHDPDRYRTNFRGHDSNLWNGEYTGETKRVLVDPAVYRTERQYRYEYEVEKTGTRTVTRTHRRTIPRTGTQTVRHCSLKFGCHTTTETYTYYSTRTYTYTTTKTYTYTVTRTRTYWASSKFDSEHRFTGRTRQVKIEGAVYDTRYEFKKKTKVTEEVAYYEASKEELVRPAQYEWVERQTTDQPMLARRQASRSDDWRVGETTSTTSWVLTKRTGTTQFVTERYENEDYVVETSATVDGDVVQRYYNPDTGERITEPLGTRSKEFVADRAVSESYILSEMTEQDKSRWCLRKLTCS